MEKNKISMRMGVNAGSIDEKILKKYKEPCSDALVESALENYRLVESFGGSLSLIEHSYFESSSLLVANKRYLEHEILLKKFIDKYPNSNKG